MVNNDFQSAILKTPDLNFHCSSKQYMRARIVSIGKTGISIGTKFSDHFKPPVTVDLYYDQIPPTIFGLIPRYDDLGYTVQKRKHGTARFSSKHAIEKLQLPKGRYEAEWKKVMLNDEETELLLVRFSKEQPK